MSSKSSAYIFVAFAIFLWGTAPAVAKIVLTNLNNFQLLFFNSIIATSTLFLLTVWKKQTHNFKKYTIKDYCWLSSMGFVGVFLYFIFLYSSLMFAPAQEAFIVNYTWPIWVVIFAMLFVERKINHS